MISICPILKPKYQDFIDFESYVNKIQKQYSKHYGMVKIIPPKEWQSKSKKWEKILFNLKIKNAEYQSLIGSKKEYYFQCKNQSFNQIVPYNRFQQIAKKKNKQIKHIKQIQPLQQKFWKNIHSLNKQLYCANVSQTLMDKSSGPWQFSNLNSMFNKAITEQLQGLNTPFLFIGAWKTFFNWHIQQLQLSAINILHFGAIKVWYAIHPQDQKLFQQISSQLFPLQAKKCPLFMRHKSSYINPYKLGENYPRLRICKMYQAENQISIAFSGSYHCGFNTGFNVAEAVNYSVDSWLSKFLTFQTCKCDKRIGVVVQNQEIINNLKKNNSYNKLLQKYRKQLKTIQQRANKQKQQDDQYQKIDKKQVYKQFLSQKTKKINKNKRFIWIQKYKRFFPSNYQEQKQIIESHIQCDGCKKWQKVSSNLMNKYQKKKFYCKDIKKSCIKKKF